MDVDVTCSPRCYGLQLGFIGNTASRTCKLTGETLTRSNVSRSSTSTFRTAPLAAFDGHPFNVTCIWCPEDPRAATDTSPCGCLPGFWSKKDIITKSKKDCDYKVEEQWCRQQQFCTQCPYGERCLGGNNCTGHFGGTSCTRCKPKYYTLVSACFPCPETPGLEYIAVAIVGISVVYW